MNSSKTPKNTKGTTPTAGGQTPTAGGKTPTKGGQTPKPGQSPEDYATNVLKLDEAKAQKYIKAFMALDDDGSGKVSKSEFRGALDRCGFGTNWDKQTMDAMFEEIDEKKTGYIDVFSFLNRLSPNKNPSRNLISLIRTVAREAAEDVIQDEGPTIDPEEEKAARVKEAWDKKVELFAQLGPVRYAKEVLNMDDTRYKRYSKSFSLMDLNGSGDISKAEFIVVLNTFSLGTNLSRQEVDELFDSIDKGDIGEINLMNFLEALNKENPNKSLLGIIKQITFKAAEIEDYKIKKKKTMKTVTTTVKKEKVVIKTSTGSPSKKIEETKFEEITMTTSQVKGDETVKKAAPVAVKSFTARDYARAFNILNYNENQPIQKADFEDVVRNCLLIDEETEDDVNNLFKDLDNSKRGEISLADFSANATKKPPVQKITDFIESIFDKEEDILAHKMNKKRKELCHKAFGIINFYGEEPIVEEDFGEIVHACSLLSDLSKPNVDGLYKELDNDDGDNQISLEDFVAVLGFEPLETQLEFLENVLAKEAEILEYKRNRGKKLQENSEKAFLLLDFNGSDPITKQDFAEIVKACSLLENTNNQAILDFFDGLDKDKNGEINFADFLGTLCEGKPLLEHKQFVEAILAKEKEITEYKKNRGKKQGSSRNVNSPKRQGYSAELVEKAFGLINFHDKEPIDRGDFEDLVIECALLEGSSDHDVSVLFRDLDKDKNELLSLQDFSSCLTKEKPLTKHSQLMDSILVNEEKILEYKRRRGPIRRGKNQYETVFIIINFYGKEPITLKDFCEILVECSVIPGYKTKDVEDLYRKLDKDKDGKLTFDEFVEVLTQNNLSIKNTEFVGAVMKKEDEIIAYKNRKLQKKREADAERAFVIINFNDREPIMLEDFVDIVKGCGLLHGESDHHISDIFHELDRDVNDQISLSDFLTSYRGDVHDHTLIHLLEVILAKEKEILAYKDRRKKEKLEEKVKKAFSIVADKGTEPLKKTEFVDLARECTLLPGVNDLGLADLFGQLDADKNTQMSLEDLLGTVVVAKPVPRHLELIDSILAKEVEILNYKVAKYKKDKEEKCEKAFSLINFNGLEPINWDDFQEIIKECELAKGKSAAKVQELFQKLDTDKDNAINLNEFKTCFMDDMGSARVAYFLKAILDKEAEILEYKKKRQRRRRQEKAQRAFYIWNFNDKEPISREDFLDVVKGCELLKGESDQSISGLFDEIDKNKNNEMDLTDLLGKYEADDLHPKYAKILDTTFAKEPEIQAYKQRRRRERLQDKAKKAFSIIADKGTEPVKRADFVEISQGCTLLPGTDDLGLADLFKQLDKDNNSELSQTDLVGSLGVDNPVPRHVELVESIIRKEPEIAKFKKNKNKKLREDQSLRAFAILNFNGNEPIKREDFTEVVSECNLLEGPNNSIGDLFRELDKDKNNEISLGEFTGTCAADEPVPKHTKFVETVIAKEPAINAFKLKRRKAQLVAKAKKAFAIIADKGTEPVKKSDFVELSKECRLLEGVNEAGFSDLFRDLDINKNNELTESDLVGTLGSDNPVLRNVEFIESIIKKEPEIRKFKNLKAKKLRESQIGEVYLLLNLYENSPIKREDFVSVAKDCGLVQGASDQQLADLFRDLDKDKNNEISLADLVGVCGADNVLPKHSQFIDFALAKEPEILAYKQKRKRQEKLAKCEEAFLLLDFNGIEPIKKQDFNTILKDCNILPGEPEHHISDLFQDLDKERKSEITLPNFLAVCGADDSRPICTQLVESTLAKKPEIAAYKQKRKRDQLKEKAKKAFGIIALKDIEPIKKQDFVEISRECNLLPEMNDLDLAELFREVDLDKNGELSQGDLVESLNKDAPAPKHVKLVDSIVAKEPEILIYKKNKTKQLRESQSAKVFALLNLNGNDPIKKDDFTEVVKECNLLEGTPNNNIGELFHELDKDKNNELSLADITGTYAVDEPLPKHSHFVESVIAKEPAISAFKQKRRKAQLQDKAKKAFEIIADKGTEPLKKADFLEISQECGLLEGVNQASLSDLFRDLDRDKNNELSQADLVGSLGVDNPALKQVELVEAIINKEPEIQRFKKHKAKKHREIQIERVYGLLILHGEGPIKKDDFVSVAKDCDLVPGASDHQLTDLFHELDHDKNNELSLTDLVAVCGAENPLPKHNQLIDTALAKEPEILAYKQKRRRQEKLAKCEEAFFLLNFNGKEPIKKQDFTTVVKDCNILPGESDLHIADLFKELDKDKKNEISLPTFLAVCGADDSRPTSNRLVEATIAKGPEISAYKQKRKRDQLKERAKKAFGIIASKENEPVKRQDFVDAAKECNLFPEMNDLDLADLFREVDLDENGELSPEEFIESFNKDIPAQKHVDLVDKIITKEPEILKHKKNKVRKHREDQSTKAFGILNFHGKDPIKKDDFVEVVRECKLLEGASNNNIADLFKELDKDKNNELSLADITGTCAVDEPLPKHTKFIETVLAKEPAVTDFKERRRMGQLKDKCEKAYRILSLDKVEAVKKPLFVEIAKECNLIPGMTDLDIADLYLELDKDKDGEITNVELEACTLAENPSPKHLQLLDAILNKEKDIAKFKKQKAKKHRESEIEKVYWLLVLNQNSPIKRDDFISIVRDTDVLPEASDQQLSDLFRELDKDKNNEISLADLLAVCGSENPLPRHAQFIDAALAKEIEIKTHKHIRRRQEKLGKCEEAFLLLNLNGASPIKKQDFITIIRDCNILPGEPENSLGGLFDELDGDKNGEISLSSFLENYIGDNHPHKHNELIESTLSKEKEILAYKQKKEKNALIEKTQRAFNIILNKGATSVSKSEFVDLARDCALLGGKNNAELNQLFTELDINKNNKLDMNDFTKSFEKDVPLQKHVDLVESILETEGEILRYKKNQAKKLREGQTSRAFLLLSSNGSDPIKKDEFTEIVKECNLVEGGANNIPELFNELDKDKNNEISLTDLKETCAADEPHHKHTHFLESVLAKEPAISAFKLNKKKKELEGKAKKAFAIISEKGQPLKKEDFTEVLRQSSLSDRMTDLGIADLFRELDNDKNNEISEADLVATLGADNPSPKHIEFIESIITKEPEVVRFKKFKVKKQREVIIERVYYIFIVNGTGPIKKEDFVTVVKESNLLPGATDQQISDLFHELDHDRNNEVSLSDMLAVCGEENSLPKFTQFIDSVSKKAPEIEAQKEKKKKQQKLGKSEEAFLLLNCGGRDPIKKQDFVHVVIECRLLPGETEPKVVEIFHEMDRDKDNELSLNDFLENFKEDEVKPKHAALLDSTLIQHGEIKTYKQRRHKAKLQDKAKKAFSILSRKDNEPVKKQDFVDTAKESKLLPELNDLDLADLFRELDHDKNGELSLGDLVETLNKDTPAPKHVELIDTIIVKEPEIIKHKKNKDKKHREVQSVKVFNLLNLNGGDGIKKDEFTEVVRECNLLPGEPNNNIGQLFHELDQDKNNEITLADLTQTCAAEEPQPKHAQFLETVAAKEPAISAFREKRRKAHLKDKSQKAHKILSADGTEPVIRQSFVEIAKGCSLVPGMNDSNLANLFLELDKDKDGEVTARDLEAVALADNPSQKHIDLIENILTKQPEINKHYKDKGNKIREGLAVKAFRLINTNGTDPIKKDDFCEVVKSCSLVKENEIPNLADLFHELDHDKDERISLEDFKLTCAGENPLPKHAHFLDSIIEKEPAVSVYKQKKRKNQIENQAAQAFSLIAENGSQPIKKEEFVDLVRECSLTSDTDDLNLDKLFKELDSDKNGEISKEDFVKTLSEGQLLQKHLDLVNSILGNESKIAISKANRVKKYRENRAKRAFSLLDLENKQSIKQDTLAEAIRSCSLLENTSDLEISGLFNELDHDKNKEISLNDFVTIFGQEASLPKHAHLVDATLVNEAKLINHKKEKARKLREAKCEKAFYLINFHGNEPIHKEEFVNVVKGCSLTKADSDLDIGVLFNELDQDKNSQLSLADLIATCSKEDSAEHHTQFIDSVISKENEVFEYKEKKRKDHHHGNYRRAFDLINLYGLKPITKTDFEFMIREFLIVPGIPDKDLASLFNSLDKNKDGKISLEDFTTCFENREPLPMHKELVDAIVARENEISDYKKTKGRKHTQDQCYKAFSVIGGRGKQPLNKKEFRTFIIEYKLLLGLSDKEIDKIFDNLDKDKDGQISLVDFLESMGQDYPSSKHVHLVESLLEKESEIIAHRQKLEEALAAKNKPALPPAENQREGTTTEITMSGSSGKEANKSKKVVDPRKFRQGQSEIVFSLLNLNGTEPIKKDDFCEVVKNCGLVEDDSVQNLSDLFHELDHDKDEKISLEDLKSTCSAENPLPKHIHFLDTVIEKGPAISVYKQKRRKNQLVDQATKAFSIIAENGSQPIKKEEFVDLVRECSLTSDTDDLNLDKLFKELDSDKNGEISKEDFVKTLSEGQPLQKHLDLVNSILGNESKIATSKANRAKKYRENRAKRAFSLLDLENKQSIKQDTLAEAIRSCSLLENTSDLEISGLFNELDHDKNKEISLNDFVTICGQEASLPKHTHLVDATLANEAKLINHKKEKARKLREGKCEKAFFLLNFHGNEPIHKEDFVDVVKGCSLTKTDDDLDIGVLFNELDQDKNSQLSVADLIATCSKEDSAEHHTQFIDSVISKENEVFEYKDKKRKHHHHGNYRKAFDLINLHGLKPIGKSDFEFMIREFILIPGIPDHELVALFHSFDKDADGRISLDDFLLCFNMNEPLSIHKQLAESILSREAEILEFKRTKGRKHTPNQCYKAFTLMDGSGNKPLNKTEFKEFLHTYSIVLGSSDFEIDNIFNNLDKDKDNQVSLVDFLESLGQDYPSSKHVQLVETVLEKEPEILAHRHKKLADDHNCLEHISWSERFQEVQIPTKEIIIPIEPKVLRSKPKDVDELIYLSEDQLKSIIQEKPAEEEQITQVEVGGNAEKVTKRGAGYRFFSKPEEENQEERNLREEKVENILKTFRNNRAMNPQVKEETLEATHDLSLKELDRVAGLSRSEKIVYLRMVIVQYRYKLRFRPSAIRLSNLERVLNEEERNDYDGQRIRLGIIGLICLIPFVTNFHMMFYTGP